MQPDLTYSNYLRLDEILNAQLPRSDNAEHDEMLFIIIHQVYELWFKQILHELDFLIALLRANEPQRAMKTIKRILTILKTVVAQIDVLETMSPLDFNAFRGYLASSSGFQSYQFRELEFVLGYKRQQMVNHFSEGTPARAAVERRFMEPTLWDAFAAYLKIQGYNVPENILARDVKRAVEASAEMQTVLIDIYRHDPANAMLCELLVDMDEGILEWRYRHIKMVERTIGTKSGTGGSAGVAYLAHTLHPLFPDLWAIREKL